MEKNMFPSLNYINGKSSPYVIEGIIRYYHYQWYPKLGPGIVAVQIITGHYHSCTTIISQSWDSKTK